MEGGFFQTQSHLYNLCVGTITTMMNLKQFSCIFIICFETKWPGSWFAMAVLGCRSLMLASNNNVKNYTVNDLLVTVCMLVHKHLSTVVAWKWILSLTIAKLSVSMMCKTIAEISVCIWTLLWAIASGYNVNFVTIHKLHVPVNL